MPHTFTDTAGRSWKMAVNVATIQKARELAGVDLADLTSFLKLEDDPVLLCSVLFAISEPESAGITLHDLSRAMNGDTTEAALFALMEATCDYFPRKQGEKLRALLAYSKTASADSEKRVDALFASGDIERRLSQMLNDRFQQLESSIRVDLEASV